MSHVTSRTEIFLIIYYFLKNKIYTSIYLYIYFSS